MVSHISQGMHTVDPKLHQSVLSTSLVRVWKISAKGMQVCNLSCWESRVAAPLSHRTCHMAKFYWVHRCPHPLRLHLTSELDFPGPSPAQPQAHVPLSFCTSDEFGAHTFISVSPHTQHLPHLSLSRRRSLQEQWRLRVFCPGGSCWGGHCSLPSPGRLPPGSPPSSWGHRPLLLPRSLHL